MRTLLVDNYDSFTFNLFQLIATVVGEPPVVVRNDDWEAWEALDSRSFDAIIISPGPGPPARAKDLESRRLRWPCRFRCWACALATKDCARPKEPQWCGHPQPMHGRTSLICHCGDGIFRSLPSPFRAVRYHSLMVDDVPPALVGTATTSSVAGEVVMAVEHRAKPQWGVQFHPESISTEHGAQLVANFFDQARGRRSLTIQEPAREPLPLAQSRAEPPSFEQVFVEPGPFQPASNQPAAAMELLVRRVGVNAQASVLFELLFAAQEHSFWLDCSAVLPAVSRFSIVGGAGPLGEWVTAETGQGTVTVTGVDGGHTDASADMFSYLCAQLAARELPSPDVPLDFTLGYVGYLGYERKADCDGEKVHPTDLPDAAFLFCDRAVVLDHETADAWSLTLSTAATRQQAEAWLDEAEQAVRQSACPAALPDQPARRLPMPPVDVVPRHSQERYAELVEACLEKIRAGESYEVCLTNTFTVEATVKVLETFRVLRRINPVPYGAYLSFPGAAVLSASPERFLRITADGRVQTKPIKGTRPRGTTLEEDAALAHDLATAEKDRAENLMIVDLLRNDLGMVAEAGSVKVTRLFDVETFATVHHLGEHGGGTPAPLRWTASGRHSRAAR